MKILRALFFASSLAWSTNVKSAHSLLLSRVSRWVEVLSRETLSKNEVLTGSYQLDWQLVVNVFSLLEKEKIVTHSEFIHLMAQDIENSAAAVDKQREWIRELSHNRVEIFGSSESQFYFTEQDLKLSGLKRIEEDLGASAKEIYPPIRWLFLWDASVEGSRLHTSLNLVLGNPWETTLKHARQKILGESFALNDRLLAVETESEILQWMTLVHDQIISEKTDANYHYSFLWFLFAREGIESLIVLFCIVAGLGTAFRRKVFFGAITGILCSIVFYDLLQVLITQNPSASWIRFFVLINVFVSMAILLIATNFNFHRIYWTAWISKLRAKAWAGRALFFAGFFAVFREGIELGLATNLVRIESGSDQVQHVLLSILPFWILLAFALFVVEKKLPLRIILMVSGAFMILVTIVFASFATRLLQSFEWLPNTPLVKATDLPAVFQHIAYNGSWEATLAMILTSAILLIPLSKTLYLRLSS